MPQQIISLILAVFLGAAPAAGPAAPAAAPARPVEVARLEIQVTTGSPVTEVRLVPGAVVADRVFSASSGARVESRWNGWTIRSWAASASVRLGAVFEDRSLARSVRLRVGAAGAGGASVRVLNASRSAFEVTRLEVPGAAVRRVQIPRARLFGPAEPVSRRADPRRLVLAAYYPWFGDYGNPRLTDRPAQPRRTRDAAGVLSMTRQARAAGIDGFVVSWSGEQRNGAGLDLALRAAERTGGVVSVYLEAFAANARVDPEAPADPAVALRWLEEALRRASSPAFLRSGGVPVVFVFRMNALKPWQWALVLERLERSGRPVRLVGDAGLNAFGSVEWGYHQYSPNTQTPSGLAAWNRAGVAGARLLSGRSPKLFAATVSPGYDDRRTRGARGMVVPRGPAGERYAATWEAALAADPDWVLVTSWNEWFEGTAVEPGRAAGDLALRQTAAFAARFKALR